MSLVFPVLATVCSVILEGAGLYFAWKEHYDKAAFYMAFAAVVKVHL